MVRRWRDCHAEKALACLGIWGCADLGVRVLSFIPGHFHFPVRACAQYISQCMQQQNHPGNPQHDLDVQQFTIILISGHSHRSTGIETVAANIGKQLSN